MQVPEGKPHAGMAHHKIDDEAWTSLAVLPTLTPAVKRSLRPVSTAATRTSPPSRRRRARVFAGYRRRLRVPLLARGRARLARGRGGAGAAVAASDRNGGGAYDDEDVTDERYWAAAELYVTTGDAR